MFRDPTEAGTPADELDVSETAGTPVVEDGSEAGESEVKPVDGRLAMTWKAKAERVNELEAKVAQLEAERGQRTTTDNRSPEVEDARGSLEDAQRELEADRAYLARVEQAAKAGNEEARAALAVVRSAVKASERSLAAEERTVYRLEMADVPEARRTAVRDLMTKTPGLRSPALAFRLLRGEEAGTMETEIERLRRENEELRKTRPQVERRIPGASKAADAKNGIPVLTQEEYAKRMAENPAQTIADRKAGKFKV